MDSLTIERLSVRYGGVHALNDVSFSVREGTVTGLIGPNGAGKTTLIDALTGMVGYSGTVRYCGDPIDRWSAHGRTRKGLVRTFQSVELFRDLTIEENLRVYADQHGGWSALRGLRRSTDTRSDLVEALERFGIGWTLNLVPDELPHGTLRLVSIARALVARPKLLLLDEPAAGLNVEETRRLAGHLHDLVQGDGLTILLVDHDMDLVLNNCDEVHVINFGRWLASGTPAQIRAHQGVREAYLGAEDADDVADGVSSRG